MKPLLVLSLAVVLLASCKRSVPTVSHQLETKDSLIDGKFDALKTMVVKRQWQQAARILDSLQPVIDRHHNVEFHVKWMAIKADVLTGERKFDSARLIITEQMRYASENDTTGRLSLSAQSQYADWLMERDSLRTALRYLEDANYLARKVDSSQIPRICFSIMQIYLSIWDHDATRRYLEEGWQVCHMPRYYSQLYCSAYASAFLAYYARMQQFDSAVIFYNIAIKDTVSFVQPYFKGVLDWNMGDVLLKKKDYKGALSKLTNGYLSITKYDGPQAIIYSTMASINDKLERYPAALAYTDTAIQLAHQQRKWESVTNVWKLKGQIQEKLGNYREASRAFDSALFAKQVLMDSSIARQAREIQTEYQVKAKDDQIASLGVLNVANQKIAGQQRILLASLIITFTLIAIIGVMWYRRRRLTTELRENTLRQQLLRTQMEPHFIFNTLAILQGYIYENNQEKATLYLNRFSKLLRLSLTNARQPLVSLDSELEALEDYLSLQVMQFEGIFSYKINLDPLLDDVEVYIPPMLLQPFVENAILHGFADLSTAGYLNITVTKRNQLLHCVIEDNGKGIERHNDGKPKEKASFATAITVERLQILSRQSGQKAVLSIEGRSGGGPNSGTRVEILIPYRLSPSKEYQQAPS